MDRFIFLCVFEGSWRVWSGSMGKVLVTGLNAKQMLAANFGTKMLVIMLLVDVGMMRLRGWEEGGRGRRRGVRMMLGEQGSGIWEGREMLQKKGVAWGKEIHLKQEVSSESGFEKKALPLPLARTGRQNQFCFPNRDGCASLLLPPGWSLWEQLA